MEKFRAGRALGKVEIDEPGLTEARKSKKKVKPALLGKKMQEGRASPAPTKAR
jgi:hypothetical protein